jgi:hypothetical protein
MPVRDAPETPPAKSPSVTEKEAAENLVSHLDDARSLRAEVAEPRHEMQLGFVRVDARFDRIERTFDAGFARSRTSSSRRRMSSPAFAFLGDRS